MTTEDEKIWALYAKNVKKLGRQEPQDKTTQPAVKSSPQREDTNQQTVVADKPDVSLWDVKPETKHTRPPPQAPTDIVLDKRVERNLRQGDVVLEARLDLHGMTRQEAYDAFCSFLDKQARQHRRLLLVITGKGHDGQSVLRTNLPRWCAEPSLSQHILALRPAAPQHGGQGAWYVLLRKQRA